MENQFGCDEQQLQPGNLDSIILETLNDETRSDQWINGREAVGFFARQVLSAGLHITIPARGDFLVEGKFLFEKLLPVKSPETDLLIPAECFCFSGFYDIKKPYQGLNLIVMTAISIFE